MKNKKAVNRLVILLIIIVVVIIVVTIIYSLTRQSIPPKLPESNVPIVNDTNIEKPLQNITPGTKSVVSVGSGGGGSGGSSGGNTNTNPPVVTEDGWGKRDLGGTGTELNENETPGLPSLKLSYKKFIDFIRGFSG